MNIFVSRHLLPLSLALLVVSAKHNLKGSIDAIEDGMRHENLNNDSEDYRAVQDAKTIGDLPSDGFCWIHENGKYCFHGNRFRSVTMLDDEYLIEEFLNDQKYSYTIQNTQKLRHEFQSFSSDNRKLVHALSDTSWLDSHEGVKYNCVEEHFPNFPFNAKNKELIEIHGDFSSVWRFQDWMVNVDSNMVPVSIMTLEEDHSYKFFASIQEVERIVSEIDGCDPDAESDFPDVSPLAHDRVLRIISAYNTSISNEDYLSGEAHRELNLFSDFQAEASNTQWCGLGNDEATTNCPNPDLTFDFNADNACRRHDHAKYSITTLYGLPRFECYVDHQLIEEGGHNWAVNAIYGKYGTASIVGCVNYQSYKCWTWVGWIPKYVTCGSRYATKWGYNRYDGAVMRDGYKERIKQCPYDYLVPF